MVAKFFPGSDLYYLGGSKVHVHVTDSIIEQLTRALRWLDYMPPNLDPDPLMITRTTARMSPAQAPSLFPDIVFAYVVVIIIIIVIVIISTSSISSNS
ncbi:hypothetical protein EV182_004602 [Spiromyces aspiralis]|uniref:Uncharacterized protein n=1 Tax=Spiromyces aspiralis TaxID=68401 RepID=A0ACC1HP11_9FUNG|nr:hypothetical protein EV182_004602 [Spiromyces aspiralis]